jgi:HTH-type transcriptional regulator/antitoxin HigA
MNTGPAEAFPVATLLLEELEARGWTQTEFAEILGRPPQVISEIMSGRKEITRDSAAQIAAALGTTPQLWLNHQDHYHLWKNSQDARTRKQLDDVRLRARLNQLAPLAVLRKRGLITGATPQEQALELCRLLEIDDIEQQPRLPMAARRSNVDEQATPTQNTWLACVRLQARQRRVAAYSADGLRTLAGNLSRLLRNPTAFATLPDLFADVGVCLVFVEAFPSSKIDGASFLLDGIPVIGTSGRGHRMDKVLFTLLHEVAHVVLDHVAAGLIIDESEDVSVGQERDADLLARSWALPDSLPPIPERISQNWLATAADLLGVHPIIIVGRLQKDGVLNWRSLLAKDAPTVNGFLRSW